MDRRRAGAALAPRRTPREPRSRMRCHARTRYDRPSASQMVDPAARTARGGFGSPVRRKTWPRLPDGASGDIARIVAAWGWRTGGAGTRPADAVYETQTRPIPAWRPWRSDR